MKIICVYDDLKFSNPIMYTFSTMFSVLGVKCIFEPYKHSSYIGSIEDALIISYGRTLFPLDTKYRIHIYQSKLFGDFYKTAQSLPVLPLSLWKGLPIIYRGCGNINELLKYSESLIETNIDIVASAFFMLSRYEEIINNERDQHGRFPAESSVAYKEGFLTRPIVNDYINILLEWIRVFYPEFQTRNFWNDFDFVACLTHDVDCLKKWHAKGIYNETIKCGYTAVKERKPAKAISKMIKSFTSIISFKDPYWNLMDFVDAEKPYGFSSSFYFFGISHNETMIVYSLKFDKLSSLIHKLQQKGCEIGLHGSFDSYNNFEILKKEKESLERISGNIHSTRQHALRFDVQETFAIYEKLGIKCDTTLGYAQHEGFRAGFCFPFYPYCFNEDRVFNVLEFPLIIMDKTLMDKKYRSLNIQDAWQSIESLMTRVKKANGCIALLFHNNYVDKLEHEDNMNIYKQCLKWISDKNGIGLSIRDLFEKFL